MWICMCRHPVTRRCGHVRSTSGGQTGERNTEGELYQYDGQFWQISREKRREPVSERSVQPEKRIFTACITLEEKTGSCMQKRGKSWQEKSGIIWLVKVNVLQTNGSTGIIYRQTKRREVSRRMVCLHHKSRNEGCSQYQGLLHGFCKCDQGVCHGFWIRWDKMQKMKGDENDTKPSAFDDHGKQQWCVSFARKVSGFFFCIGSRSCELLS